MVEKTQLTHSSIIYFLYSYYSIHSFCSCHWVQDQTNGVFLTTMPICWQLDAKNFDCLTPRMVRHGLYDTSMESSFSVFFYYIY